MGKHRQIKNEILEFMKGWTRDYIGLSHVTCVTDHRSVPHYTSLEYLKRYLEVCKGHQVWSWKPTKHNRYNWSGYDYCQHHRVKPPLYIWTLALNIELQASWPKFATISWETAFGLVIGGGGHGWSKELIVTRFWNSGDGNDVLFTWFVKISLLQTAGL